MFYNDTHTDHDLAQFAAMGIDPETREPRKQPTFCTFCGPARPTTMNRSGLCDRHDTAMRDAVKDLPEATVGGHAGGGTGGAVEAGLAPGGAAVLDE